MRLFLSIWPDQTATIHAMDERQEDTLHDTLDDVGETDDAHVYEMVLTEVAPLTFSLTPVRVLHDGPPIKVNRPPDP